MDPHTIWRWFGEHAWPIRYRYQADEVVSFLFANAERLLEGAFQPPSA